MVDSIKGSGGINPVQNVTPSNKPQAKKPEDSSAARESGDVVEISPQAQDLLNAAQAEQAAKDVSSALQEDLNRVLGIDPTFAEQVQDA